MYRLQHLWAFVSVVVAAAPVWAQGGAPKTPPATLVDAVKIEKRVVTPKQAFVGTVVPLQKAVIGSAVDGRVIEFPINEGDYVEKDSMLAQLLTNTIGKDLEAAKAELALRKEELKEMLAGSRPEEIEQARARMEAAKARMEYSRLRLQRLQTLFRQGRAASTEDVDEATAAAEEALNAYLEATAAYELAQQGPRSEHKAQAQARVDMQQAVVDRLADQLEKHTIRTRFSGYISAEHTEVGAWVNRGDPVAEVVALDTVDIEVHVVENHIPYVDVGQPARVTLPALPGREFSGKVALLVPQADPRTRTFPVKVRVENEKTKSGVPVLKAGMLAQVTLPVGAEQEGTAVPKDALVLEGARKLVWVIDPKTVKPLDEGGQKFLQGVAKSVPVTTGAEDETWVLVRSAGPDAIEPGQYVVTRANERIFVPIVKWRVVESGGSKAKPR